MIHLYFAYGANMHASVLAHRLGRTDTNSFRRRYAVLTDHRLVFDKMSSTDNSVGYGNVKQEAGHQVEGVINELDSTDLARLDALELVPHHYLRSQIAVHDSLSGGLVLAEIYTAHPSWIRPDLKPLRSYLDNLLGGADLLSADYVTHLRSILRKD
jgi:hypothetical protein